jgi:hypothetical protein
MAALQSRSLCNRPNGRPRQFPRPIHVASNRQKYDLFPAYQLFIVEYGIVQLIEHERTSLPTPHKNPSRLTMTAKALGER